MKSPIDLNRSSRVILHYHGLDIRGRWQRRKRLWASADRVLVSTPDLLEGAPEGVMYVPNPVDTELFKPLTPPEERLPKGLLIIKMARRHQFRHIKPIADRIASRYGIRYDVHFSDLKPIRYLDMPKVLNRYQYFLDIPHGFTEKDRVVLNALSLTGLQALACGCKVLTLNGCLDRLPRQHMPDTVARKLLKLYDTVINRG